MDDAIFSGNVTKRSVIGRFGKRWQTRYFVLRPDRIDYYKSPEALRKGELQKSFHLEAGSTVAASAAKQHGVAITGPRGELVFAAGSEADQTSWVARVREIIEGLQDARDGAHTAPPVAEPAPPLSSPSSSPADVVASSAIAPPSDRAPAPIHSPPSARPSTVVGSPLASPPSSPSASYSMDEQAVAARVCASLAVGLLLDAHGGLLLQLQALYRGRSVRRASLGLDPGSWKAPAGFSVSDLEVKHDLPPTAKCHIRVAVEGPALLSPGQRLQIFMLKQGTQSAKICDLAVPVADSATQVQVLPEQLHLDFILGPAQVLEYRLLVPGRTDAIEGRSLLSDLFIASDCKQRVAVINLMTGITTCHVTLAFDHSVSCHPTFPPALMLPSVSLPSVAEEAPVALQVTDQDGTQLFSSGAPRLTHAWNEVVLTAAGSRWSSTDPSQAALQLRVTAADRQGTVSCSVGAMVSKDQSLQLAGTLATTLSVARARRLPGAGDSSLLDYIRSGCRLVPTFCVDYSANEQNTHRTFQYLAKHNSVESVLHSMASACLPYSSAEMYAYGYGGLFKGSPTPMFALNGNLRNPIVSTVEALMDVYREAVEHTVQSSMSSFSGTGAGPAAFAKNEFSHVINVAVHQVAAATKAALSAGTIPPSYRLLIVLATGDDVSADRFAAVLDKAMSLPLSIVVVGIGSAEFTLLQALCSGEHERVSRVFAQRNFVHFVRQSAFLYVQPGAWVGKVSLVEWGVVFRRNDPDGFLAEALRHVPTQVVSFMNTHHIGPSSA